MFFLLKWCIFKWQVLFVILKGKVRRTHMQMLISRKTVGPFIVSKGPPMRMVWGSQGPSKSCYKWKPCNPKQYILFFYLLPEYDAANSQSGDQPQHLNVRTLRVADCCLQAPMPSALAAAKNIKHSFKKHFHAKRRWNRTPMRWCSIKSKTGCQSQLCLNKSRSSEAYGKWFHSRNTWSIW